MAITITLSDFTLACLSTLFLLPALLFLLGSVLFPKKVSLRRLVVGILAVYRFGLRVMLRLRGKVRVWLLDIPQHLNLR